MSRSRAVSKQQDADIQRVIPILRWRSERGSLAILRMTVRNDEREAQTASPFAFAGRRVSKSKVATEVIELVVGRQEAAEQAKRTPKRPAKRAAKKKAPAAAGATATAGEGKAAPKKKRVCNFKRHAKNEISGAFPEIVHTLIEEAKSGSLNHTRLLFDLGGVKDQVKEELKQKDKTLPPSFADMLMHALIELSTLPQGESATERHDGSPDNQPEMRMTEPEASLTSH